MSIRNPQFLLFIAALLFITGVHGQAKYQFGLLPAFNLNGKLKNKWSVNAKLESRQLLQRGVFSGENMQEFQYLLTDFSIIAARKLGLNSTLAGGYLIRSREGAILHRLIQQYNLIQRMAKRRFAHRFSCDQTFSDGEEPTFRVRYRIASEFPLNGASVDPFEFYVKVNNEYVNAWEASS